MSKAFDTVNLHTLTSKLLHTSTPKYLQKYISNYIKGRQGYTLFQNCTSKTKNIKTGVPQGGVLSPALFNLYTSDIPQPPPNTTLTSYADDLNPSASHHDYKTAQDNLQPYLDQIYQWTTQNDLQLNPLKSQATLFTPYPAEYNTTLNLQINNQTIPTVKNPKILGLTFDPKLTFSEHIKNTKVKANNSLKLLKALTGTTFGKTKETLLHTYKTYTRPIIEYASTIWAPIISDTNYEKIQQVQNSALRIATGCTSDTSIDHLHQETKVLPIKTHTTLHSSNLKQKTKDPQHPLHHLNFQPTAPRHMKSTIFNNPHSIIDPNPQTQNLTPAEIKQNIKRNHQSIVETHLQGLPNNKLLNTPYPPINPEEEFLPRKTRRILAQLRTNKSPILLEYLHKINPANHPDPTCPLCHSSNHNTNHLFTCTSLPTTLTVQDLWNDPRGVEELLSRWADAMALPGNQG